MKTELIAAKEEIRQTVSLTGVIETYTRVKGHTAICPFHPDTHPSLSISEAKGLWHCWSCGAGGDTFTFVMKAEEVSFPVAVKILCDRYGIPCTYDSPQATAAAKQRIILQRSKILDLKIKRDVELANWKEHDLFLGGLWKRVYRSSYAERGSILESIEDCFMELEDRYKQIEKEFEDGRKKIYARKTH